jgi:hypothetical protein
MRAALQIGRDRVAFDNAVGYHDHNWGFWKGVRWQWGQVAQGEVSVVYGRVFPPADVADPARIPGFLAVLGRDGPTAFSSNVTIDESRDGGHIDVRARGTALELSLIFDASETVRTAMALTAPSRGSPMSFLQLGGVYHVSGILAGMGDRLQREGSAETFRPRCRRGRAGGSAGQCVWYIWPTTRSRPATFPECISSRKTVGGIFGKGIVCRPGLVVEG